MEEKKPTEQLNLVGVGITILLIVGIALIFDISTLRVWVEGAGVWAPLVFIFLKVSTIVIAPLSGSPLYPLVGLFFGFWPGIVYVAIGDFLGYTIAFYIGRFFGRKFVNKLISNKEESLVNRIVEHVGDVKGFFQACLTLFAIPEVLAYGAGLSRLPYRNFILILWPMNTAVTALLVLFGSTLKPSNGSIFIGLFVPIIGAVVMIIGGTLFVKGLKKKKTGEG
ncbi:MAG: VTT domain-containing protein [Patescibacteria group bacterium]